MYRRFLPEEIWIEKRVANHPFVAEILGRVEAAIPQRFIADIGEEVKKSSVRSGKKVLVLAKQEGKFLKPCPGTQNYVCCGYYFINFATNCDVGCTYCILQGYLNNPYMTVYVNVEDLLAELEKVLSENRSFFYRIGTGELTDSLTLEHLTHYSKKLIPFFLEQPNAVLELKTKTTQVENLLEFHPEGRLVVSWSLNPDELIRTEEPNAPLLAERLEAARRCAETGYLIGFHFDPIIWYPEWREGYRETVRKIFRRIPAEQIVWISLGALRFPREMDRIIRERHSESRLLLAELFPGKDGKFRYFRPLREQMFREMVRWIRGESEKVQIYLCMESPEVWRAAFGENPLQRCGLPRQLDEAAFRCMARLEARPGSVK